MQRAPRYLSFFLYANVSVGVVFAVDVAIVVFVSVECSCCVTACFLFDALATFFVSLFFSYVPPPALILFDIVV